MAGPVREKRFFGCRGFNPLNGKYLLFMHRGVAIRSLRMTCKRNLSAHDAGIKKHMVFRINSRYSKIKNHAFKVILIQINFQTGGKFFPLFGGKTLKGSGGAFLKKLCDGILGNFFSGNGFPDDKAASAVFFSPPGTSKPFFPLDNTTSASGTFTIDSR